jgi:hypothetical protein
MDINNLGKVQPASNTLGRTQNLAKATPRGTTQPSVQASDTPQTAVPAPLGDDGGQPDAFTPRGSLLDVLV